MESKLSACGYAKPLAKVTTDDKVEIMKLICIQQLLFEVKPSIDQFFKGLEKVYLIGFDIIIIGITFSIHLMYCAG